MIKYVNSLIFIIFLTGCATNATGPLFSIAPLAPENMGTLYISKSTVPIMTPITVIKINDKPFVSLAGKGYSYVYLTPGIYRLSFVSASTVIFMTEVEMLPGMSLYEYFNEQNFSLNDLIPSKAQEYLKDFHYVSPVNTKF